MWISCDYHVAIMY